MKPLPLAAAAVVVGGSAGIALALTLRTPATAPAFNAQATWAAGAKPAPGFRLHDQTGRPLALSSLRGRTLLVTFLDSRCTRECPVEGRQLAAIARRMGRGVDVVVVSVDPWADTAASARAFAAKAHWSFRWHWLLGTRAELRPVWASYAVGVKRTPSDIVHTIVLYVVDRNGWQRAAYLLPFDPPKVAADVRRIASA